MLSGRKKGRVGDRDLRGGMDGTVPHGGAASGSSYGI